MNLVELFFSWRGEISRLPFVLANVGMSFVLGMVILMIIFLTMGSAMMGGSPEGIGGSILIGLGLTIPLILLSIYCSTVLMIKRLHDIGTTGLHVIWIYGLGFASAIAGVFVESSAMVAISLMLSIAQLVAYLWLIFMPGNGVGRAYYKDVFE
jgi:uncharacterized membrane protein YhaH (DUF805 family)